jgi:hypothetical protein
MAFLVTLLSMSHPGQPLLRQPFLNRSFTGPLLQSNQEQKVFGDSLIAT